MARKTPGFNLRIGSEMDAHMIRIIQFSAPWIVWVIGLPVAALALRMARRYWGHPYVLSIGLFLLTVGLSALMWKITAIRKGWGRLHPVLNVAASMGWLWAMTTFGPKGLLGILYLLGGIGGCLAWNFRNATHADPVYDVLDVSGGHGGSGGRGPRYLDAGFVARAVATRVPAVRTALEAAGNVVPVLKSPWEPKALQAGSDEVLEGKVVDGPPKGTTNAKVREPEIVGVDPNPVWLRIQANWRKFTTQMDTGRELNGARLVPRQMSPTRIKTKVKLLPGRQTVEMVENAKKYLISLMHMNPAHIIIVPNPKNGAECFIDFITHDVLAKPRLWTGPEGTWCSIADSETVYGFYEDGVPATIFQPADLSKGKQLTHFALEGMNGSGKSTIARLLIATGLLQWDVDDWALDPVKTTQTFGPLARALTWFAVTKPESKDQMEFVVDLISAKARYLGEMGYDGWEPGCGLPFNRVWIEEGNLVAGVLGDTMEEAGNTARSAGVALVGSFQRMHHESVPTGFRAVFAEAMSFGVNKFADAFILADELKEVGCDPSQWKNDHAGMHYWNKSGLSLERRAMEARSYNIKMEKDKPNILTELCDEYAEEKMRRLKTEFPDYWNMLAEIDSNRVFQSRTTGYAVYQDMLKKREEREARALKKAKKAGGGSNPDNPVPAPRPEPEPEEIEDDQPNSEMEDDDIMDADKNDYTGEREYQDGKREPAPTAAQLAKELESMGERPEYLDDPDIQSGKWDGVEFVIPAPHEVLAFGRREDDDASAGRQRKLAYIVSFLAHKGPGWKFQPHQVVDECKPVIGGASSWYRGELSSTLATLGVVEHDPETGTYQVARDIRSEMTAAKIQEFLDRIPT